MDSLNQIPDHSTTPPSKVHTWIIILLVWTAVFSLISVGLLLTKSSSSSLSQSDITSACQDGTINALTTNLTRISDACTAGKDGKKDTAPVAPAVTTGTSFDAAKANGTLPKLTLPLGWTAEWSKGLFTDGTLATFTATKGINETCTECGGMDGPTRFFVTSLPLAKAELMDPEKIKADYIERSKAADTKFTNIVVTSTPVAGGTLVSIDGSQDIQAAGAAEGVFHILRFTNATKYVELTFNEYQSATNADWLVVKSSLDWSTVK